MTSAPRSASSIVAYGPASTRPKSTMRMPSKADADPRRAAVGSVVGSPVVGSPVVRSPVVRSSGPRIADPSEGDAILDPKYIPGTVWPMPTSSRPLDLIDLDDSLTDDEKSIRAAVRTFTERSVQPHVADWFEKGTVDDPRASSEEHT